MSRKKSYKSRVSSPLAPSSAGESEERRARLAFAEGGNTLRTGIVLDDWIGQGIDRWVWSFLEALEAYRGSGLRREATLINYGASAERFFRFLCGGRQVPLVAHPAELSPLHVRLYAAWLRAEVDAARLTRESARQYLNGMKAMVRKLIELGHIPGHLKSYFPMAFISWRGDGGKRRHPPLSDDEQVRLAQALKADLVAVCHGRLALPPSEALTVRFLIVAMRTGLNLTPLLELRRDALLPGLLPGARMLVTEKPRAFKVNAQPAFERRAKEPEPPIHVPLDVVGILERTLFETRSLVAEFRNQSRLSVWLYRTNQLRRQGQVMCLSTSSVQKSIKSIVARHRLTADDGRPLRLNCQRLRNSFFKRAFRASEGDIREVAQVMGHTPKVADSKYSRMDEHLILEAAEFVNEDLMSTLRKRASVAPRGKDSRVVATPVSACRDPFFGEHAPKNGATQCHSFVKCLFCHSCAIVGEDEDLWRLFSFQEFASQQSERLSAKLRLVSDEGLQRLKAMYEAVIPFIDEFCARSFGRRAAVRAKARAKGELHPFWRLQLQRSKLH